MTAGQYWFARSRTAKGYGRQVTPVSWQGWAVILGFAAAMVAGGVSFLLIALLTGRFLPAIAVFVILAVCGAGTFLWAAATRSDPDRTPADYAAQGRREAGG